MAKRRSPATRTPATAPAPGASTAASASPGPSTARPAPDTPAGRYIEALAAHHARGNRLVDALLDAFIDGQRDTLALGAAVYADPTALAHHASTFLTTMHAAHARMLAFAQVLARTQAEATADLHAAGRRALGGG